MGALGVAAGVALLGVMGGGPPEAPAPERPEQTVSVDEATIAIQPLGRIPDALLARQVRLIEARFGQHVRVLPARALPSEAWHPQRKQYRAGAVLDMLYVHKPTDVTHVVGLTLFDLYEDGWEYLYGFSQVHGQVAVYSMQRTLPADARHLRQYRLAVDRAEKVLVHELGHSMSLGHCSRSHCVMSAVDTGPELDRLSRFYCRRCTSALKADVA